MRRAVLIGLALLACEDPGRPAAAAAGEPYTRALERYAAGDEGTALEALDAALHAEPAACQRALLEPAFDAGLRDQPAFRRAVHEAAVRHRIGSLVLAPEDEPGEWIAIQGHVVDEDDAPVPGAVVRLFATDTEGRYHPEREGEECPRIFGTLVADENGRFDFRTVRPGPYPGTRNPRHVHVGVRAGERRLAAPGYAVFDDDPLLEEPGNEEPREEALRIRMRVEDGRALGDLVLPVR